jgi:hypothetical protein
LASLVEHAERLRDDGPSGENRCLVPRPSGLPEPTVTWPTRLGVCCCGVLLCSGFAVLFWVVF